MPLFIRAKQITERYGISRVTAWRWTQKSSLGFPKPIRPNNGASLYDAREVDAWFAARYSSNGAHIAANDTGEAKALDALPEAPEAASESKFRQAFEIDDDGQYSFVPSATARPGKRSVSTDQTKKP